MKNTLSKHIKVVTGGILIFTFFLFGTLETSAQEPLKLTEESNTHHLISGCNTSKNNLLTKEVSECLPVTSLYNLVEYRFSNSKGEITKIDIDIVLYEAFEDFVYEATQEGVNLDRFSDLKMLLFSNAIPHYTGREDLGLTLLYKDDKDFVFLNSTLIHIKEEVPVVLYHELTHVLLNSIDHCVLGKRLNDIFGHQPSNFPPSHCPEFFKEGSIIDIKGIMCNSDLHKKQLFNYIKERQ